MNPFTQATVRDSSPAEVGALQKVCDQLGGFNPDIHLEWVDGFLTSLAAGPVLPTPEVWLPALCGDAFERAFADPTSQQQAQRVLHTRLKVLCEQLKPDALLQDNQPARLAPLMMEWTDAEREKLLQDGVLKAEDLPAFQIGAEWAMGFIDGTEAFGETWLGPLDDEADEVRAELLDQVVLLFMAKDEPERAEMLHKYYPDLMPARAAASTTDEAAPAEGTTAAAAAPTGSADPSATAAEPTTDDLISSALFAVQDLRLFWMDHAPKHSPRRVQAEPGRNDPCACGSGKKYKKCHGAATP